METLSRRLATAPTHPWPDEPVPVSLVITDLDVGGAERALVALARGLDRDRWSPSVVCLGPEGALGEPLRAAEIPVVCLDVNRRRPLAAIHALATTLQSQRPQLVQSFLFHANIAARLAARKAGRPWVLGGIRVAEREKGWHRQLDHWTQRLSLGSVCVSEGVRRFSVEVAGIDPERLTVIPNGIDPRPYDHASPVPRATLAVPETATLLLFVGRIERQKGLSVLIQALGSLAEQGCDVHLLVVGDGPDRSEMEARASASPTLKGRIHWLGRRDDVPALLATCDVLVLPSLWEGMPNVVLEAMASRRAVVATRVEGSEDLVSHGETGWLVEPGSSHELAKALAAAAGDREKLRRFGEAGRARVEALFTQERVIASYERLWARILGLSTEGLMEPGAERR